MTREEAKRRMEICRDFLANNYSDMGEPNFTAFNMAIQALSQEPKADKPKADKLCEVCGYRSGNLCVRPKDYICRVLSQEPTNEKELNKAYTFGHNRGVKAYYNEQLCTVELPEAVFRYILSLVPTEEAEQEPCDDAISRREALKCLNGAWGDYSVLNEVFERIDKLPPVTQKSGKWIKMFLTDTGDIDGQCSECGFIHKFIDGHTAQYNYCPNCSAKMESEDKE